MENDGIIVAGAIGGVRLFNAGYMRIPGFGNGTSLRRIEDDDDFKEDRLHREGFFLKDN